MTIPVMDITGLRDLPRGAPVAVAMSGGVDSSVAAALLARHGCDVVGLTMHLWTDPHGQEMALNRASGCCSVTMAQDAAAVAERIGFRHYVLDLSQEFHGAVVRNFGAEYFAGRTPNPCVRCNSLVKWQTLLNRAHRMGCEWLATGHYARTDRRGGRVRLRRAGDAEKDQSYALWGLSQESLARTIFPLGELSKTDVRALAAEWGLATADKPESQDICFIPDNDYRRFLNANFAAELPILRRGEIIGPDGGMLGTHDGVAGFTVGQRKGLGIAHARPLYVTRIDAAANRVFVDYDEHCRSAAAAVRDVNWLSIAPPASPLRCGVKVRYRDTPHPAMIFPQDADQVRVVFDDPVRAVTPGQSAVFYDEDVVLGGGILVDSEPEVSS